MMRHLSCLVAVALASCNTESPMPNRTPPPSPGVSPPTISAFTTIKGSVGPSIGPGERLIALHPQLVTWWEHEMAVEAVLPNIPVDGARWLSDGKRLRVGLGTLDLAARKWLPEAGLQHWEHPPDKPVTAVAWLADDQHVAIEIGPPWQPVDRPTVKRTLELVIANVANGQARSRLALDPGLTAKLAASEDRVIIAGKGTQIVDLDANVIAGPAGLPDSPGEVAFAAGMFAVTGNAGDVTMIRPRDGRVLATWRGDTQAINAVPISNGALSIDIQGVVRVACLEHGTLRTVAQASTDARGESVQLVGDRIVVSGGGPDTFRWATFSNPCR
jgi:hypothetical protein